MSDIVISIAALKKSISGQTSKKDNMPDWYNKASGALDYPICRFGTNRYCVIVPAIYNPTRITIGNETFNLTSPVTKEPIEMMFAVVFYSDGEYEKTVSLKRDGSGFEHYHSYGDLSDSDCTGRISTPSNIYRLCDNKKFRDKFFGSLTNSIKTINADSPLNRTPKGLPALSAIEFNNKEPIKSYFVRSDLKK